MNPQQYSCYVFKVGVTPAVAHSRHVHVGEPVLISSEPAVEAAVKLEPSELAAIIKYA